MKIFKFFACVFGAGHEYVNSHARLGYITCKRCRHRRRNR